MDSKVQDRNDIMETVVQLVAMEGFWSYLSHVAYFGLLLAHFVLTPCSPLQAASEYSLPVFVLTLYFRPRVVHTSYPEGPDIPNH